MDHPFIIITRDDGKTLGIIKHSLISLQYVLSLDSPGAFIMLVQGDIPADWVARDRVAQVWLPGSDGRGPFMDMVGLADRWVTRMSDGGDTFMTQVSGRTMDVVLERKIVAYKADSDEAQLANVPVDDGMKDVVDLNLGAGIVEAARTPPQVLDIQADTSEGASVTKAFSHRRVDKVITDLGLWSRENGPEVFPRLEVTGLDEDGKPILTFKTAVNQPGPDRGLTSPSPLVFSPEAGNVENGAIEYDFTQVVSHVYVGGQGEGPDREVVEVSDVTRSDGLTWGRTEAFLNATQQKTTASLTAAGEEYLGKMKARTRMSGVLVSSTSARYGQDWKLGHRVVVKMKDQVGDVVIRKVVVSWSGGVFRASAQYEGDVT